ncbi:interleukin-27 subunit alpha [Varanus komodoensis]|uniref:interleukin-27 subunit alpha n=1 Tax=Varanus komodoensis TaxID=61221 RepID=UPI001CF79CE7|nr:interleukin-27 subunit alpha [Varanus komodoensis]
MHLRGTSLLLHIVLSSYFHAAFSVRLQEEKGFGYEATLARQKKLQKEFGSSLKLSRHLLQNTKTLTHLYHSHYLPGVRFDLLPHSEQLPSVSLDLRTWLSLPDAARLSRISKMLPFYQALVQQLSDHEAIKKSSIFVSQFDDLSLNLRDLIHHVNYQISLMDLPAEYQSKATISPAQIHWYHSQWKNHQKIYVILRSLENFLCRVTRDFLMLKIRVAKGTSFPQDTRTSTSQPL